MYFILKCNRIPKSILDFMYFIMKCNRIPKSILDFKYFIMKCNRISKSILDFMYFIMKCNRIPKPILDFMYFILKCNRIPKSILDFMYFIMKCNNTYWCWCTSWFVQFEQMCAKDLIQLRGGIESAPMHYFISNVKYFCKSSPTQDIPIWQVMKLIHIGGI